jgi:hypothetical protein
MKILLPLGLMACLPGGTLSNERVPPVVDGEVSITEARIQCNLEDGAWELDIITAGWSGGAVSYWTEDGGYVEKKALEAREYAEDGSWEHLVGSYSIIDDWRQAGARSTAFSCHAEHELLIEVRQPDGSVAACVQYGERSQALDTIARPMCPETLILPRDEFLGE